MSFKDKVIWITGASSGIGEHLSYELSVAGAYLILSSRNLEKLELVKNNCRYPERVKILAIDLENFETLPLLSQQALSFWNRIDILVNNAGLSQRSLTKDTIIDVDYRLMRINFMGAVVLTKSLLPHWIEKDKGHVVSVTSMVGKFGTPYRSGYSASKHALHGFMDSLRAEVSQNIKVQLVCPGFVQTNVSINAVTADGSAQGTMDSATKQGIDVKVFAQKMVHAMGSNKDEIYIAGNKEMLGLYVKRFFPSLFNKLIKKFKVT